MLSHETAATRLERERPHRDKVLTFRQWCAINGFSVTTGQRLVKAGKGPRILQLTPRRLGIRESDNREWQESRARSK